jgi:hypothetical protein
MHGSTNMDGGMDGGMTGMHERGEMPNDASGNYGEHADTRNSSMPSGGSTTNSGSAPARDRMDDEVDDLIRSSKNGRDQTGA